MSLGADGVISVAGNACPGFMALLVKECLNEDFVAAAKIHPVQAQRPHAKDDLSYHGDDYPMG